MSEFGKTTLKDSFFAERNEAMLDRLLYTDFQRRIGGDLSGKQKERLVKTVRHYMNEVYENLGDQPIRVLNTETLSAVVPDFLSYLRRQGGAIPSETSEEEKARMDVSSRFSQLQTERQDGKGAIPDVPNFRIPLDDTPSTALSTFEQIKKQREAEAARDAALAQTNTYMDSTDRFSQQATAAKQRDEKLLAERAAFRTSIAQAAQTSFLTAAPPTPDPRAFFFGNTANERPALPGLGTQRGPVETGLARQSVEASGLATANPTLALPDAIRTRAALPQDNLIKQDDVVSYRENEYNLFMYSSDRDWVSNSTENRYNFSVNFDPANNRSGFSFSPAANIKFKNIVRIELVKALVPTEGVDILAKQTADASYNTDINVNALSFPYLMIRFAELDTNNFGTNNYLDNAFGVVQYDANWISDNTSGNRGYLAMIPKFMKCQKVYYPTPLATLQKLTVQIQRPDGALVSDTLDTLDVSGFLFSSQLTTNPNPSSTVGTRYADTSGAYIWVQTSTWFNKFMVSQGDRIVFKNLQYPSSYSQTQASTDFLNFLQRSTGHVVVDVGRFQKPGGNNAYLTGGNIQGYCNYVILRNAFQDPTTGSTSLLPYGGTSSADTTFRSSLPSVRMATGRFLNLNHQVQIVLRVITRDMDSMSRLRPDNM